MNRTHTASEAAPSTVMGEHLEPVAHRRPTGRRGGVLHGLAWLVFAGMVWGLWRLSELRLYSARSDFGYWLGVVGGVLMLLLFAYPLRKRWAVLSRVGKAKRWFVVHMFLGVFGPLAILAHCTFSIGSVNAGVALGSMLVVALSGIAGRFIYLRLHRGLGGERESFEALGRALGFSVDAMHTQLHFTPKVEARLRRLERHAGRPGDRWGEHAQRLFVLPWQMRRERRRCQREAVRALAALAGERGWSPQTLADRQRRARLLIAEYTGGVLRVAQLAAYSRLFSLWHLLHVPFVVLMVLCAIAHIVAVHAY